MFASLRRTRVAHDDLVGDLPDGYVTLVEGDVRIVVGPTGVFAVTAGDADLNVDTAARHVARSATALREVLARELSWAPFVDPLVVVDEVLERSEAAAVVPRRMLSDVLTAGNVTLAGSDIERIVDTLRLAGHTVIA